MSTEAEGGRDLVDAPSGQESAVGEVNAQKTKRKTRWRWLLVVAAVWLLGDFLYSRYVAYRVQEWEASVPWTAEGLAPDAAEKSWGNPNSRVALLMVHGFSDSPQMYRKIGPWLGEAGYFSHAILLPGFGQKIDAYAGSEVEKWMEKVEQEVQSLRQQHDEVWIVAHSLGGAITIQHALRAEAGKASKVDGIVLLAPAIEVSDQRSPVLSTRFWHEASRYVLLSTRTTCTPFEMDARDPQERDRPFRNVFTPRSMVDNTFALIDANRGRASELELPCLVFLATEDRVVDSPAISEFYKGLAAKRKKLVSLGNSGHMVAVDLEWETIAADIAAFVGPSDVAPSTTP